MSRLIVGFFAGVGLLTMLAIVAIIVVVVVVARGATPRVAALPNAIVLRLDLSRAVTDGPAETPLTRLVVGNKPTLREILDGIERAGDDARVKGILAQVGDDSLGLAKVQQLRDAIARFRAKGKFAIADADSFGEFGPGTRPYYLAAAFDEIWLQPMGNVGLTGLYAEVPFVRGTLDLLGVSPDLDHRSQYKTAMNTLTETAMTAPHREEVEALLGSMSGQIVRGIAQGRKMSDDAVRGLIDRGPFFADEAKAAGLVDRLGYRDEALARALERAGTGAAPVGLARYLDAAGHPNRSGPVIALIYGNGMITSGGDTTSSLTGTTDMSANAVARAFRTAMRDKDVRAILFRIDSPGGSVVASETIWRAVVLARERGKPVVVSMGDVAGSGGYYIAAPADKIVAEPATLTGSIGVLAGKFAVGGLLRKLGVTVDSAQVGADAAMFSDTTDFSPEAHRHLEAFLDLTYQGFKDHVAQGRHMTPDAVEAVAKGRVWSGEDAKANGLVDALGGYDVALRLAKEAAKLPADAPVKLVVFPPAEAPGTLLYDRLFDTDRERDAIAATGAPAPVGQALARLQPLLRRLAVLFSDPGALTMPPIGPVR